MYVPPLAFDSDELILNLKPFESMSKPPDAVVSAVLDSANKYNWLKLYEALDVSSKHHEPVESVRLYITNRGLNPQYTNGPSVDPLPV